MALKTIFLCDICGAHKKDANHWFSIFIEDHQFICIPGASSNSMVNHACGVEHAMTFYSRFLSTGTLEFEFNSDDKEQV
jgi:hypothetical protein